MCCVEIWKPIPEWEDLYQASSHGRIKSEDRVSTYVQGFSSVTRCRKGVILKHIKMTTGYWGVILCREGTRCYVAVHKLVTATFYGQRPLGLVTRHLDGDVDNNRLENLVYGTAQENADDRQKHGRTCRGEQHPRAVLTDFQVDELRRLYAETQATTRVLAQHFGVSSVRVTQLLRGGSRP